jgi:hypothetical protein
MLSSVLAITLLVAAAPAPAPEALDLSSPQGAAQAFGSAALAGNRALARSASADNESSRRLVNRLIAAAAAHSNLEKVSQATLHLYPEVDHGILQELRTFPKYAATGMWDIQGEQARWLLDKSATPGVRITATRSKGKWRVNPESMNAGLAATQGDELSAFTTACNKVADDIQAGKLHSTDEIRGAHRRYQRLALQHAPLDSGPATAPAVAAPLVIDLSTPQSALRGALVAEQVDDNKALVAAVDPADPARAWLQALIDADKAQDALREALLKRFGDPAEGFGPGTRTPDPLQRATLMQAVENFKVVVAGDEARFEGKDWPVAHKTAGQWRIALAAHLAPEKQGIAIRIAMGNVAREMTGEVNAGRFNSFVDFQIAIAGKFQAVTSKLLESRTN